jgi:hypothetical protein
MIKMAKKKKVKVRQHRRKKRSGGSSVVKSHVRLIKRKLQRPIEKQQPKKLTDLRECWRCKKELKFPEFVARNPSECIEQLEDWWQDPMIQLYCCHCYGIQKSLETGVTKYALDDWYLNQALMIEGEGLFKSNEEVGSTDDLSPFIIEKLERIDFHPSTLPELQNIMKLLDLKIRDLEDMQVAWNLNATPYLNNFEARYAMEDGGIPLYYEGERTEVEIDIDSKKLEYDRIKDIFGTTDDFTINDFKEYLDSETDHYFDGKHIYVDMPYIWCLYINKNDFIKQVKKIAAKTNIILPKEDLDIIQRFDKNQL